MNMFHFRAQQQAKEDTVEQQQEEKKAAAAAATHENYLRELEENGTLSLEEINELAALFSKPCRTPKENMRIRDLMKAERNKFNRLSGQHSASAENTTDDNAGCEPCCPCVVPSADSKETRRP